MDKHILLKIKLSSNYLLLYRTILSMLELVFLLHTVHDFNCDDSNLDHRQKYTRRMINKMLENWMDVYL